MNRFLILFAREPRREAREKGFDTSGEDLFATFAAGWLEAARRARARLIVATPPEDRAAWRGRLSRNADVLWIAQRGGSFGERLERVARRASKLGGRAILVGGDVAPSPTALSDAFEQLDRGAGAVLAPAADGGVSLLALEAQDLDLLRSLAPRQRGVAASLESRLLRRGRTVAFVAPAPDVDGRRGLRSLLRRVSLAPALASLARRALLPHRFGKKQRPGWSLLARAIPVFRGPPLPT